MTFSKEIAKFEKMWEELEYIPTNLDDEIEVYFYWREKGIYRFDIWHCFDEKLPNGIVEYAF